MNHIGEPRRAAGYRGDWVKDEPHEPMPPNPKQVFGDKKPPLDEFPLSAQIAACLAGLDGDFKYGFRNWREHPVEARTYIKGALRHLRLFEEGEDFTRDSKVVHNLGAVMMGCAILYDAQVNGALIDNRVKSPAVCDLLHEAEESVAYLAELQNARALLASGAKESSPPTPAPIAQAGADTPERVETTIFPPTMDTESVDPVSEVALAVLPVGVFYSSRHPEGFYVLEDDERLPPYFVAKPPFVPGVVRVDALDIDFSWHGRPGLPFWSLWHPSREHFPPLGEQFQPLPGLI